MHKYLLTFLLFLLLLVGIFLIGRYYGLNQATEGSNEKVDTLFIYDTITQIEPIIEQRITVEKVLVPVEVRDTIWQRDTMYVELQKEQVIWEDSLSRVYASGILPQVDSVHHFVKERMITRNVAVPVKQRSRWGVGVQLGYGVQLGKEVNAAPYIGVGISYNLLSW